MNPIRKLAVGIFLLSPMAANADVIVDQNNPTYGGGFCYMRPDSLCGQSFQQDADNIAGAGIFIGPDWNGTGQVTMSIWEQYIGGLDGLVATGTSSVVDQNSGWVDVFWAAEAINPLTTYYLVLEASDYGLVASYDSGGFYNGLYGSGTAVFGGVGANEYDLDLTFRTYKDDIFTVPEPATLALLGIGLAGMGMARRRRMV